MAIGLSKYTEYEKFLASKRIVDVDSGFDVEDSDINPMLFDFQRALVKWALRRGRAALFADTGLGKTNMQLAWADMVCKRTGGNAIIFAPLAVSLQTQREGVKFGIHVTVCKSKDDVKPGINITNYERIDRFDHSSFVALVADESGILKGLYGKTRATITEFASHIPYRLACTATPSPNDHMELANHAEFLGVMSIKEVFATFFIQDFNATAHKWRLKGHARVPFWKWLASWARALRNPSDLGFDGSAFDLPPLNYHRHTLQTNPLDRGLLVPIEAIGLSEQRQLRNDTAAQRAQMCADLVNGNEEQWLVWCDLNVESSALTKAIDGAVEVKGSDSIEHKEKSLLDFADGKIRVLVSKPSIAGHGLNFQSCHNVAFVGLSNSFESMYQAVRRCWRFGQTEPVNIHIITTDADGAVITNIERKERQAAELFKELLANMGEFQADMSQKRDVAEYKEKTETGNGWTLHLGDSIEVIDKIEDESVGLIVFSPAFPGMYTYSNTPRDMGNVKDMEEMIERYKFLLPGLLRVLKPGRTCAVHLAQGVAFKHQDGYCGIKDFRGTVIKAHEDAGFIYYGEVCIDKCPQFRVLRTKDRGLMFKTLATDSALCRTALADYVLQFRKHGDNPEPIKAGTADHLKNRNNSGWVDNHTWVEWAAPVWYRKTEDYPGGISEGDVLNFESGRESDDERHLCSLQLGVIERVIKLWSNPGDLVLDPFNGIGSSGYQALKYGRRYVGIELKESYFNVAIKNLKAGEKSQDQGSMLAKMGVGQ